MKYATSVLCALVFVVHHIVCDGWSLEILAREFVSAYFGSPSGSLHVSSAVKPAYADYVDALAKWRASKAGEKAADFWKGYFSEPVPHVTFPPDLRRPEFQTYRGFVVRKNILGDKADAVSQRMVSLGATSAVFFLGMYALLLSRYSGARRPTIAIPSSGRAVEAVEDIVGLFANLIVVRAAIPSGGSFADYCLMLQANLAECVSHEFIQFDELVDFSKAQRSTNYLPLAQVGFSFLKIPKRGLTGLPDGVVPLDVFPGNAKFDVDLEVWPVERGFSLSFCRSPAGGCVRANVRRSPEASD